MKKPFLLLTYLLILGTPLTPLFAQSTASKDDVKICLKSLEATSPGNLHARAKQCLSLASDYDLEEQTLLSGAFFFRSKFLVFALENQFDIEKIALELSRYYWVELSQFVDAESVKGESTEALNAAYDAMWTYDWYTLSESAIHDSHTITTELKSRGENIGAKGPDLFTRYNAHRLFKMAKRVRAEFELSDVPELPHFIDKSTHFEEKLPAIYEVNTMKKELHLSNFDLGNFTGLIVATLTSCPEAIAAAAEIPKSPELLKIFSEHAVWLEDQVAINFDKISEWNSKHPWAPMKSIYRRKYWPIATRLVPTFYFYRDGKVVVSTNKFEPNVIMEGFKKIGF